MNTFGLSRWLVTNRQCLSNRSVGPTLALSLAIQHFRLVATVSSKPKVLNDPDSYTIGWIAALPIERAAAAAMLDEEHERPRGFFQHPNDKNSYTWGRIGEHNVVIASLKAGVYGLASAGSTASSLSSSLPSIRVGLLVGIGGGIARPDDGHDIRLGDVVVSQPDGTTGGVCQYDLVKAKPGNRPERKGFLAPPPDVLLHAIANIQSAHERKDSEIPRFLQRMLVENPKMAQQTKKTPGYVYQGLENDHLFQSSYEHASGHDCRNCDLDQEIHRDERESTTPEIHYGIIASGNTLVKDSAIRDQILADMGEDCICFEMEAAGLMNHFPCLVIRGICDYADSHKSDRWQRYASATAAAYAKELLTYVPTAEVQESKRALDILESVNEKIDNTQQTTLAMRNTVESLALDSYDRDIRKWLAAPDPSTNANRARELRHEGTGAWLFENPIFQKWTSGMHKHLWLHGMPGCGKTVLSTTVLDHLAQDNNQVVLSFFFDFKDATKQTNDGLLRSIALQLYQGGFDSAGHLDRSFREHETGQQEPTTGILEQIVRAILADQQKVFIVLDALDESETRYPTLLWIEDMFSSPVLGHVQIIYTSREEAELMRDIPELIGDECCLPLDKAAINVDIRSYVLARLQHDYGFTKKNISEDLLNQIRDKVGNGADGMFRWAACQLDSLARCLSPSAIEEHLNRLPADLTETYDRILQSIPHDYRKSSMRLLQFIVYSDSMLSLEEAVEIVATDIESERPRFDVRNRVFDVSDILRHCTSLVSIGDVETNSDTTQVLYLAHFSVMEYLQGQKGFGQMDASKAITTTCLIYLRDIEGSHWRLAYDFPLASYAARVWLGFAVIAEASEDVRRMIVTFLREEELLQRWLSLYESNPRSWDKVYETSGFYYACGWGLKMVARALIVAGADVNIQQGDLGNALQAASYYGHIEVVQLLLEHNVDVHADGKHGSALQAASIRGHIDIVRLLLDNDAAANAPGGLYGNALNAACFNGHVDVVRLLINSQADVQGQEGCFDTALMEASAGGNLQVVQILLDQNVDVNAEGFEGQTALKKASEHGHLEVVKLLLHAGANPNAQSSLFGNALLAACPFHLDIVQLLLDEGVDVNTTNFFSKTPLRSAIEGGNEKMLKMLIDRGACVNTQPGQYSENELELACKLDKAEIVEILLSHGFDVSPDCNINAALYNACGSGNEDIVKMMIGLGADPNARSGEFGRPLHAACRTGNEIIVDVLMQFGADPSLVVDNYGEALRAVCEFNGVFIGQGLKLLADLGVNFVPGHDIDRQLQLMCGRGARQHDIQLLLDIGANVNAHEEPSGSPLQAACQNDEIDTIDLLLELGADINNVGEFGSPLWTAAFHGKASLVEMLIELGADVNAQGSGFVKSTNALLAASDQGHREVVRILLERGAEVSPRDEDGRTPLYAAACNGHVDVVELLVEAGADVHATAYDTAYTPIIVASANGHLKVVELLLEKGAIIVATHENGPTPLDTAVIGGHVQVVRLLLQRGAEYPTGIPHHASFHEHADVAVSLPESDPSALFHSQVQQYNLRLAERKVMQLLEGLNYKSKGGPSE